MSSRNEGLVRVALGLFALAGILFAPPWVPVSFAVLLALRFRASEVIVLGLLMDLTWLPVESFLHPLPIFTLGGIALVWVLEPVRSQLLTS